MQSSMASDFLANAIILGLGDIMGGESTIKNILQPTPTLDCLLGDLNYSTPKVKLGELMVDDATGKQVQARMFYTQRGLQGSSSTDFSELCDPPNCDILKRREATFAFDKFRMKCITVPSKLIRECVNQSVYDPSAEKVKLDDRGYPDWFVMNETLSEALLQIISPLRRDINNDLIAELLAAKATFDAVEVDGVTPANPVPLRFMDTQFSRVYPGGLLELGDILKNANMHNAILLGGSGNFQKLTSLKKWLLSNIDGIDLKMQAAEIMSDTNGAQFQIYIDDQWRHPVFGYTTTALNEFIAFKPGAIQLHHAAINKERAGMVLPMSVNGNALSISTTMPDPIWGDRIEYDVFFEFDKCSDLSLLSYGAWKITITARYGLLLQFADRYQAGDPYFGFRDIINFAANTEDVCIPVC